MRYHQMMLAISKAVVSYRGLHNDERPDLAKLLAGDQGLVLIAGKMGFDVREVEERFDVIWLPPCVFQGDTSKRVYVVIVKKRPEYTEWRTIIVNGKEVTPD